MKNLTIIIAGILLLLASIATSQEVIITNFPIGVGSDVSPELFAPYFGELQAIKDTLHKYPLARAIVTGGADGERYRQDNDAKNPGLALGRAHVLRNLLINEFKIDSSQIIIQSGDTKEMGGRYRFAAVRVINEFSELNKRVKALEDKPPVEKHFTEVKEITSEYKESLGLQFGVGLSTSPFGGIPIATGAISWKNTLYAEGFAGHSFWKSSFEFEGIDLDTRRRLIGGQIIYYPSERILVGIVGGWIRIEEISQKYYKYAKLSEGPLLGLRVSPYDFISITGAYNPSKQLIAGESKSETKKDRFLLSITAHITFGGEK
ncbi:MAG: hypothetical protein ABIE07_09225 [Candidatus Zixiibacteriota bacterium]